jgi:ketol-acid reductoisomerase
MNSKINEAIGALSCRGQQDAIALATGNNNCHETFVTDQIARIIDQSPGMIRGLITAGFESMRDYGYSEEVSLLNEQIYDTSLKVTY